VTVTAANSMATTTANESCATICSLAQSSQFSLGQSQYPLIEFSPRLRPTRLLRIHGAAHVNSYLSRNSLK
jgi:hypothetical protein